MQESKTEVVWPRKETRPRIRRKKDSGDYKSFKDQTQNSQFELRKLARFMPGGENLNQNRGSIKCGKRIAGKVAARFSVICTNISSYVYLVRILVCPKNSMSPGNGDEYSV